MATFFLPGPFADPAALGLIMAGTGDPISGAPEMLADHSLRFEVNGPRLALVFESGAGAEGRLVVVDAAAGRRLAFAMAAYGAAPRRVTVGGRAAAVFVAGGPDAPPDVLTPADWTTARRARHLETLAEVMAHFGQRSPDELPHLLPGIGFRALARARGPLTATPFGLRAGFTDADVEPVGLERPYAKFFCIEEHSLRHRRFDGGMSPTLLRAVFVSGDAVTVLPFDPRRGLVALIEQFRVGAHARCDPSPWFLEAVAGRCDANESPENTARREAAEEAGLTLGRMERIASYYTSPGIAAEYITAFVAEADLGEAGGVHGLSEEDEDIRVHVVPLARAVALIEDGEVNNAPLLISLLWLASNSDRLVADWAPG